MPENGLFKPETGKKKEKNRKLIPGTTVFRMRNPSLIEKLHERYLRQELKEKIYGTLRVMKDFPVTLTLIWGDISVSLEGAEAEPAKINRCRPGSLENRFSKQEVPHLFLKSWKSKPMGSAMCRINS